MKLKLIIAFLLLLEFSYAGNTKSKCFGTTSKGKLKNGVKLPSNGINFESYSFIAELLGRTYVHSEVRKILLNSFVAMYKKYPKKVFKYAETGFEEGGQFKPHKTHRNGLSVDVMVPVTENSKSVHLPTNVLNKWGYNIDFDLKGNFENYKIDYEAFAALLVEFHLQAKKEGYDLWRVIFDPKMTPDLYKTSHGDYLKKHIQFSKKRAWVRHDEHFHVDFLIPCESN